MDNRSYSVDDKPKDPQGPKDPEPQPYDGTNPPDRPPK
jgi:hypothetical protein